MYIRFQEGCMGQAIAPIAKNVTVFVNGTIRNKSLANHRIQPVWSNQKDFQ